MRLKKLSTGTWTVLGEVADDGACPLEDELAALHADPRTTITVAGIFALWEQIPVVGPRALGTDHYHQLDADNDIYEFIRRRHRILCFQAAGRVVVCSHVMRKESQRMPKREITRAVEMRKRYLAAVEKGDLIVDED